MTDIEKKQYFKLLKIGERKIFDEKKILQGLLNNWKSLQYSEKIAISESFDNDTTKAIFGTYNLFYSVHSKIIINELISGYRGLFNNSSKYEVDQHIKEKLKFNKEWFLTEEGSAYQTLRSNKDTIVEALKEILQYSNNIKISASTLLLNSKYNDIPQNIGDSSLHKINLSMWLKLELAYLENILLKSLLDVLEINKKVKWKEKSIAACPFDFYNTIFFDEQAQNLHHAVLMKLDVLEERDNLFFLKKGKGPGSARALFDLFLDKPQYRFFKKIKLQQYYNFLVDNYNFKGSIEIAKSSTAKKNREDVKEVLKKIYIYI